MPNISYTKIHLTRLIIENLNEKASTKIITNMKHNGIFKYMIYKLGRENFKEKKSLTFTCMFSHFFLFNMACIYRLRALEKLT